jgi:SpoIID/LytB domain protein
MQERVLLLMRTYKALFFTILLLTSSLTAARADIPPSFAFSGAGYGHGVGMSQIGAKVRALAGESATAILNYYYKDVVIAPVVDTHTVRVNLAHAVRAASFVTATPDSLIEIFQGDIGSAADTAPIATFPTRQKVTFRMQAGLANFGAISGTAFTIRWKGPGAVVTVGHPGETARYRYGQIQIKVVKQAMEVTNSLSMHDEYLLGISEVPSSWPIAVLEAQAIASRSYALSKLGPIRANCDCHVYDHISDQNFVGYAKEIEPKFGKNWRAAVINTHIDSSTSLAILSGGKPVQAYYFSSSGGATQTTKDAWGQATTYTQSVPDPGSLDIKHNPRFVSWNASATQATVATAFLLPDIVTLEIVSRNEAGAVTSIKGIASDGSYKILRGDTFRSRVKIPSPYFSLA